MSTQDTSSPYALPQSLKPDLARVLAYWEGLKRGGAEMPFWDDVKFTDLPDLADKLALVDVFQGPERFRFGMVGTAIAADQPQALGGLFLDEVALDPPLHLLRSQCAAAVEARRPTYFADRLVLPLWGDGLISMLLVAAD